MTAGDGDLGMRRSADNRLEDRNRLPGQRRGEPPRPLRSRTINVIFRSMPADGTLYVQLPGGAAGNDGGGYLGGELRATGRSIPILAKRLRERWMDSFVLRQPGDDGAHRRHRFADTFDLSRQRGTLEWDSALRELARIGYEIFQAIFLAGDDNLIEAGERLQELLRSGPQIVTIQSDEVFIPWHMLYVPPIGANMLAPDCPWTFDGFLGYQHHIEQTFMKRPRKFQHDLEAREGIRAGLNVDASLDKRTPVVGPLRQFLDQVSRDRIRVCYRESYERIATDLSDLAFNDQVMYFNCHGIVDGAEDGDAHIALTDQVKIYTSHFETWFSNRVFTHNPVVFVNACEGGQLSSVYLDSFGHTLLKTGANCLVGPQLEVPADFARKYALEFFRELLRGVSIGDVVKGLAQGFAERHANPLGLVMSLYRGLDTYFDVTCRDDPAPEEERVLLVPDDPLEQSRAPA